MPTAGERSAGDGSNSTRRVDSSGATPPEARLWLRGRLGGDKATDVDEIVCDDPEADPAFHTVVGGMAEGGKRRSVSDRTAPSGSVQAVLIRRHRAWAAAWPSSATGGAPTDVQPAARTGACRSWLRQLGVGISLQPRHEVVPQTFVFTGRFDWRQFSVHPGDDFVRHAATSQLQCGDPIA
jgi:hypothetical protein